MHNIAIGCDPNATEMKRQLIEHLVAQGHEVTDFGSDDVIYANTAQRVAKAVADGTFDRGVLICGTGLGMSIAANKVSGAFAALLSDCYSAERARKSNNANIACLGAFTVGLALAKLMLDTFMTCEYKSGTSSEPKVNRIIELDHQKS
ncbi:MAG: RpiB/LacA/LacB family sugar-phosphate isomerase [Clostridia bacterium]